MNQQITPPHYSSKQLIESDRKRGGIMPLYQIWLRRKQTAKNKVWLIICKIMYRIYSSIYCNEIATVKIGRGLYIGHPSCITVNPSVIIGDNVNIHKGVTIGIENRGKRKGTPIIGSNVWIGVNSTIVGNIRVGDDVLIAPNTFVNCDIPSHSIVLGNPCIIKHRDKATEAYINDTI